jgi:hypothetical protein
MSLLIRLINFCLSWPAYASKSLVFLANNACYSPPRLSRTIVVPSSSNMLQRKMCNSQSASPNSSSTPMTRTGKLVLFHPSAAQSFILSCFPQIRCSTPDLSGNTREWGSLAATPNIVYLSSQERPSQLLLPSTPNQNALTSITQ